MIPGRTWLVAEAGFEVLSSIPFSTRRYEEEVALRATAENEFVVLKKVRIRLQGREGGVTFVTIRHSRHAGQTAYPWTLPHVLPSSLPPIRMWTVPTYVNQTWRPTWRPWWRSQAS